MTFRFSENYDTVTQNLSNKDDNILILVDKASCKKSKRKETNQIEKPFIEPFTHLTWKYRLLNIENKGFNIFQKESIKVINISPSSIQISLSMSCGKNINIK